MKRNIYHGIILDEEFVDTSYPKKFKVFARRKSSDGWVLYGVEIKREDLNRAILKIQGHMKANEPCYAHFYNDTELIVIFKNKIFHVLPHISSWKEIVHYGKKLKIPEEQLDFWPNRFQDEIHYFSTEDFI